MPNFRIIPSNRAEESYDIEADSVENDAATGRTNFRQGDELVASLLNVSFRRVPDAPAAK